MSRIVLFFILFGFIHSEECDCGRKNIERIIGGEYSDEGEWPMMVALVTKEQKEQFCGGTIISKHHVITAGHCVHMHYKKIPVGLFGVVYGKSNLDEIQTKDIISPKKIIAHSKYAWPLTYDIAILLMPRIEFTEMISPVCLLESFFDPVGKTMDHTGWGMVKAHGEGSRILKKTKLQGVKLDVCHKTFEQFPQMVKVKKHHMCTFQKSTGQCKGDSGGPILWMDPATQRYNLVGIISFGWYTCDAPAVNVHVSHFIPWIIEILSWTGDDKCYKLTDFSLVE